MYFVGKHGNQFVQSNIPQTAMNSMINIVWGIVGHGTWRSSLLFLNSAIGSFTSNEQMDICFVSSFEGWHL